MSNEQSPLTPPEKKGLTYWHKLTFISLGLFAAVAIFLLVSLSKVLSNEKEIEALKKFQIKSKQAQTLVL